MMRAALVLATLLLASCTDVDQPPALALDSPSPDVVEVTMPSCASDSQVESLREELDREKRRNLRLEKMIEILRARRAPMGLFAEN